MPPTSAVIYHLKSFLQVDEERAVSTGEGGIETVTTYKRTVVRQELLQNDKSDGGYVDFVSAVLRCCRVQKHF